MSSDKFVVNILLVIYPFFATIKKSFLQCCRAAPFWRRRSSYHFGGFETIHAFPFDKDLAPEPDPNFTTFYQKVLDLTKK